MRLEFRWLPMNKRAVVLCSGGLDSSTCLALAKHQGYQCYALTFDYGQRCSAELNAAQKVAIALDVQEHRLFTLPIHQWRGSALTDLTLPVPSHTGDDSIPITYVPARNTVFLAVALSYAEAVHAEHVFIGASAVDYSGYPDCRPEYFEAFQKLANLATKSGIEQTPIQIQVPLLHLSKAETIKLGIQLGLDYSLTVTCYQATEDGKACGECDSCALRQKGFKEAGVEDPTPYVSPLFF